MMLPSLIITTLVVHSLGGYGMKQRWCSTRGLETPGKLLAPFHHYERAALEADLSFPYPAPFNLYRTFSSSVITRTYDTLQSPLGSPCNHTQCLFSSSSGSWHFRLAEGVPCWPSLPMQGLHAQVPLSNSPVSRRNLIKQKSPDGPEEGGEMFI